MVNKFQLSTNIASLLGHSALAIHGEKLQALASTHAINYEPYMGQLSDYAAIAAMSSLYLAVGSFAKKDTSLKYILPLAQTTIWALTEIVAKYSPNAGTYDPKDILAFYSGCAVACGINYISDKDNFSKIKNTSRKIINQCLTRKTIPINNS